MFLPQPSNCSVDLQHISLTNIYLPCLSKVCSCNAQLGLQDLQEESSLPILRHVQAGIQRVRAAAGTSSSPALSSRAWAHLQQYTGTGISSVVHSFYGFFQLVELLPHQPPLPPNPRPRFSQNMHLTVGQQFKPANVLSKIHPILW